MDRCQANQFQPKTVKMCHKCMVTVVLSRATETTANRAILGGLFPAVDEYTFSVPVNIYAPLGEVTHRFFCPAGCRKSSAAGQADLGAAPLLSSRLCGESSHLERGSPTRLKTKNPRSALTSTPDHLTRPFLRLGVYNREFNPFYFFYF